MRYLHVLNDARLIDWTAAGTSLIGLPDFSFNRRFIVFPCLLSD